MYLRLELKKAAVMAGFSCVYTYIYYIHVHVCLSAAFSQCIVQVSMSESDEYFLSRSRGENQNKI